MGLPVRPRFRWTHRHNDRNTGRQTDRWGGGTEDGVGGVKMANQEEM